MRQSSLDVEGAARRIRNLERRPSNSGRGTKTAPRVSSAHLNRRIGSLNTKAKAIFAGTDLLPNRAGLNLQSFTARIASGVSEAMSPARLSCRTAWEHRWSLDTIDIIRGKPQSDCYVTQLGCVF